MGKCLANVFFFQTFSSRTPATANEFFVAFEKMLGYVTLDYALVSVLSICLNYGPRGYGVEFR
jgi:hypothetical protein